MFDPEANEDCLFLNVVVPKSLFPKKMKKEEHGQKPCGGKKGGTSYLTRDIANCYEC